jgi:membrane protein YqaA with SNARE-associated domain
MMKKVLLVLLLTCFVSALVFSGQEEIDVYRYLYRNSEKTIDQLDILQNMAEAKLTGAGEFYAWALRQLVQKYKNILNSKEKDATTEKYAADEQAKILSALLGAEKYTPAAADLWYVVDGFADPLVKAEALMALGKIRATNYLPQVIRVLDNLNLTPTKDPDDGGRIAFGAIISLEKFQDPSGYLSVFLASVGWYPQRIKNQAAKSLPFIAKDPSPFMLNLLKSGANYDNPTKLIALQTLEKTTTVGPKSKAEVAVAALTEGHRAVGNNVQQKQILADLRKLALDMIRRYKSDDPAIYPLMRKSYTNRDSDAQEKIAAINAIASQKTDDAAALLSEFLTALNQRPNTLSNEETQLIRVIIPALGNTGRPSARTALTQVTKLDYTSGIKNLATQALNQIPN